MVLDAKEITLVSYCGKDINSEELKVKLHLTILIHVF